MLTSSKQVKLPLLKIEKESENDTYSFYFDRNYFSTNFLPGQYLRVSQENIIDERGNSRYFTIASSPTEKDHIMITTRIMKSNFKHALYGLKPGDTVNVDGPFGNFVLDANDSRPRVLIAGGIGITPFRSMAIFACDKRVSIPITIFASFSAPIDVIYYEELTNLKTKAFYQAIYTVTNSKALRGNWTGEKGRLNKEKILKYVQNPFESLYFIAGPQIMVESLSNIIKEIGVLHDNIRVENFPGY